MGRHSLNNLLGIVATTNDPDMGDRTNGNEASLTR
jgi:hypothetical protein